jgi:hypothetical protein
MDLVKFTEAILLAEVEITTGTPDNSRLFYCFERFKT